MCSDTLVQIGFNTSDSKINVVHNFNPTVFTFANAVQIETSATSGSVPPS